jgi:hypothetical protein
MSTAAEIQILLGKFNKGVEKVVISHGIVCVFVKSAKSATSVTLDLLRSRGFSSVKATQDAENGKGFVVYAVPASV